jgi:hypothetical protein
MKMTDYEISETIYSIQRKVQRDRDIPMDDYFGDHWPEDIDRLETKLRFAKTEEEIERIKEEIREVFDSYADAWNEEECVGSMSAWDANLAKNEVFYDVEKQYGLEGMMWYEDPENPEIVRLTKELTKTEYNFEHEDILKDIRDIYEGMVQLALEADQ